MTFETLDLSIDQRGVATLTLNRPEKRNVLSAAMIDDLTQAARTLGHNDEVRAVVLAGAGSVFCAGGDLGWMKAQMEADRPTRMREAKKLAIMLYALNTMPKPLIGRVHGDAYGGGVGMMCVCDVAVAARGAKFGLTETRLGLIPATISPYVVARMTEAMARRVFMSGRIFGAAEAVTLGLAAREVEADQLDEAVEREVKPYLSVSSAAVGEAKALARFLGPRLDEAVIDETIKRLADTWETPDAQEGIAAFFEKRPARWAEPR